MRRLARTIFILLFLVLASCKKENPNPEMLDPIYKDLVERASAAQKGFDEEMKKREALELAVQKTAPNTIERKNADRELAKSKADAAEFERKARFFGIRARRRLIVDKISYSEAFSKNLPWPDPNEYSDYKLNIRLNEASRNWGNRVPKLQTRLEKTEAAPTAAPEAKKGH
jgi:hypothetical protein